MFFTTINPATAEELAVYPLQGPLDLNASLQQAESAFYTWRKTSMTKRQTLIMHLSAILLKRKSSYAKLISTEMGKPIKAAIAEIEKSALVCKHYIRHAEEYLAPRQIATEMQKTLVSYQPLGPVLAIMPWNFPFWQVFRFAVPALLAGNVVLLKHAPICSGSGKAIAELFLELGFPAGVLQQLLVTEAQVADLIADPRVAAVTLTGSERAGIAVATEAAKQVKKVVLELGGNDPYLVLEDANINWAAHCIVTSRMNNAGQVCIAAKRVIVVESVKAELLEKIQELLGQYQMGSPLDPNCKLGPLARADLRASLHDQVKESIARGASCLEGGYLPEGPGFYYPPTLLTEVGPGMPAFDEELFGPVIAVCSAKDEQEGIMLANQSRYGLGAAVFTQDLARGERIAVEEIETGSCFVNAWVSSDPRVPFGGIKHSGYGRELSREGMIEFTNIKTVSIHD